MVTLLFNKKRIWIPNLKLKDDFFLLKREHRKMKMTIEDYIQKQRDITYLKLTREVQEVCCSWKITDYYSNFKDHLFILFFFLSFWTTKTTMERNKKRYRSWSKRSRTKKSSTQNFTQIVTKSSNRFAINRLSWQTTMKTWTMSSKKRMLFFMTANTSRPRWVSVDEFFKSLFYFALKK